MHLGFQLIGMSHVGFFFPNFMQFSISLQSLFFILILLNESSLMVFFCTSFSFISEIADSSFYCFTEAECDCRELTAFLWLIHIKYKSLQRIC